jgi:hypothetical protein
MNPMPPMKPPASTRMILGLSSFAWGSMESSYVKKRGVLIDHS